MEMNNDFKLDVVSVRLVKEAPIFSDVKITTPEIATWLIGKYLCEMDREVLCVVNLKSDRYIISYIAKSIKYQYIHINKTANAYNSDINFKTI